MGGAGGLVLMLAVLFVAPLLLASFIVAQDADQRTQRKWFGLLTATFTVVVLLGAMILLWQMASFFQPAM